MCSICKRAKKMPLGDALQLIGAAMAGVSNTKRDHLMDLCDDLESQDGDEPGESDKELAAAWEQSYRSGK